MAKTKIRAYVTTYPDVDGICLTLPASPAWTGHHEQAWDMLRDHSQIGDRNELRRLIASVAGEDAQKSLQSGITGLACLRQILADPDLFKIPGQGDVPILIAGVDSALYAQLDQLNPGDAELLHGIQSSAHELAANAVSLETVPVESAARSTLVLTLHDRDIGPLPQCNLGDIHQLVNVTRDQQWNGFLTRYPLGRRLGTRVVLSLSRQLRCADDPGASAGPVFLGRLRCRDVGRDDQVLRPPGTGDGRHLRKRSDHRRADGKDADDALRRRGPSA